MPHYHPNLDTHAAAALGILGLTSLLIIQVLVDCVFVLGHKLTFRTYLLSHLRRGIHAETMDGHHRCPPGLPRSILFSFRIVAVLVAGAVITILFWTAYAPVPAPDVLLAHGPIAIVSEMSGRVDKVYVSEGSVVRIGDPIVQLETHPESPWISVEDAERSQRVGGGPVLEGARSKHGCMNRRSEAVKGWQRASWESRS